MTGIPLFKKCGFTIDGTGYYARHLESHRLLYKKTPWCRTILLVAVPSLALIAVASGLFCNSPGLVVVGIIAMAALAWKFTPKRKKAPKEAKK